MKKTFLVTFALAAIVACNKDKFQTKPQIRIKEYNSKEIPLNAPLVITLEVTDKEGDVDDSLFVIRQRLNIKNTAPVATYKFDVPAFPDKATAEFQISFPFATSLVAGLNRIPIPNTDPRKFETDTLLFKFVVKDKAGNISDTVTSDRIYVKRD